MEQKLINIIEQLIELHFGDSIGLVEEFIEIKKELANKPNTVVTPPVSKVLDKPDYFVQPQEEDKKYPF